MRNLTNYEKRVLNFKNIPVVIKLKLQELWPNYKPQQDPWLSEVIQYIISFFCFGILAYNYMYHELSSLAFIIGIILYLGLLCFAVLLYLFIMLLFVKNDYWYFNTAAIRVVYDTFWFSIVHGLLKFGICLLMILNSFVISGIISLIIVLISEYCTFFIGQRIRQEYRKCEVESVFSK